MGYRKFLERYYEKPDSEKLVVILTQLKVKPATGIGYNYKSVMIHVILPTSLCGIKSVETLLASEDDPKCFPDDLDVMLGCAFAFKVRTQPRTRCASVIKMTDVPNIVNHVKSLIQPIAECGGKSRTDIEGDSSIGIMSLSATADNEPENDVLKTPAKKIIATNMDYCDSSQDIDSGQLSSTKSFKTIKKEKN
ncbi:hypothetical protein DEO72_LG8g1778 [Vigna unguiculata]|uniref:Uncharacterized protein n=1 Tax=Vigna unguiculata TaxID=3917 RepID=A0A4D6MSZ6_VIGUN|nr:hypothetical protein DEO72_LG8g1778 [Vigna unguiculata]